MIVVRNNFRAEFMSVPAGWEQRRMRAAIRKYQTEKNLDPEPTVLSLTKQGIRVKKDLSFGKSTESYVGHQIVRRGQFVFTPRDFDATPILCGVSEYDGCISNLYIVFDIAPLMYPKYLEYYMFGLREGYDYFQKLSFGMRFSFNQTQFENIPLLVPPIPTQKAIADFLDRETARIDHLIEKKQRLAELLKERTKLLAPTELSAHMADSVTMPIGKLVNFMTSGSRGWSHHVAVQGDLFVQSGNIGRDMELDLTDAKRVVVPSGAEAARTRLQVGDTVICITGGRTGSVAYVDHLDEPAFINQHICLLRPRQEVILARLLAHILWSEIGQGQINMKQYGVKQGLGFTEVASLRVPVPPFDAQLATLQSIEFGVGRVSLLSHRIQESIDLLRELRSSLITSAVTGQIDINEWENRETTERKVEALEEAAV